VALTAEEFDQYDRKQKFWRQHRDPETVLETWEGAAVSDANHLRRMVPLTHMAPCRPARRHDPAVLPTTDDHRTALQRRAPWWDVVELVELTGAEAALHVRALAAGTTPQGRGYSADPFPDHAERAMCALEVLSSGPAVKYYTHRRILPGYACQYYENQDQNGTSCPLVISTDAARRRIALSMP
jgi:hypothetical protein